MADEEVADDELSRSREHTVGRFRLSLETAYSLGQRHGELLLTKGEIESVDEFVAGIDAVRPADIKRVANRLLARGPLHVSVVGPRPNEDVLAAAVGA
jgi:predicted Zn-dependent peptidase